MVTSGAPVVVTLDLRAEGEPLGRLRDAGHRLTGETRVVVLLLGDAPPGPGARSGSAEPELDWLQRPGVVSVGVLDAPAGGPVADVALAVDLLLVASRAALTVTGLPASSTAARLTAALGRGRALWHLLSGTPLSAGELVRCGLAMTLPDGGIQTVTAALVAPHREVVAEVKAALRSPQRDHPRGAPGAGAAALRVRRLGWAGEDVGDGDTAPAHPRRADGSSAE